MKKLAVAGLIVLGVTLMGALPSDADGRRHHHHRHGHRGHVHTRFFVGFGPSYYWGPYPYWYYPPAPYVVYTPPPVVVQRSEPVYIQQTPPPVPPAPEQQFWYYCQSAGGFYPTVPNCSEEWVKVAPR